MRPTVLVTGASGQVGGELLRSLTPYGIVVAPSRNELDLASPASIRACVRRLQPRWIVNAAAYTAVDWAESEPELAAAINSEAVGILGEEARALSAAVIHFSTDYVFNGQGEEAYREDDPTGPLGVYGATKLAGEHALLGSGADAIILRTSWVYGATGKNFLRTILKLARERDHLRIVGDQHGAPTWSRDLANLAAHVIAQYEADPDAAAGVTGIYHAAGSGETTWAGFAQEAVRQTAELEPGTPLARVTAISTAEYPTPAVRPANSRLSNKKLSDVFGWTMMDWRHSLSQVLIELSQ